ASGALRTPQKVLPTQPAAPARAAAASDAEVWAVAPMVTDVDEAAWFVEKARYAGVATPGVLVQVPAAALLAGALLRAAAFAVLDTAELTQFTLAADRELP